MQARINEMRELLRRASSLDSSWMDWQDDPVKTAQAVTDYANLKDDLAQRIKAFNRLKFAGATPWYEVAYDAGIRHAHQAMVARAGSGPKLPKWHTAVQTLRHELEYYLNKLENGST